MKIPVLHGWIDRRILVNFTAEPDVVQPLLPRGFRPKLHKGKAVAGICLIRLKHLKPKGLPDFLGASSENGAHRIAVEWEEKGAWKEGVYIPRRDTSSRWNVLLGGRLFPGKHHLAKFNVQETNGYYHVAFNSSDDTNISITAKVSPSLPPGSVFDTLGEASVFFEKGAAGYSPGHNNKLDGLKLRVYKWKVQPLEVTDVKSSFFENTTMFEKGAFRFDNALLMTRAEHEWSSLSDKLL